MKRKIMITLIALISVSVVSLSFSSIEPTPNPPTPPWGFTIDWDDINCNCNINGATIAWRAYVWDNGNWTGIDGIQPLNISPSIYTYDAEGTVDLPECYTENCFMVGATVTYYDGSDELCCVDLETETCTYYDLTGYSITLVLSPQ